MVRTQVQLSEDQIESLRQLSKTTGKSVAGLIRNGVDLYLAGKIVPAPSDRIERALRVAGMFSSRVANVSEEHDAHLADAFAR